MSLRIGHIDYLNCVPFFSQLHRCGFAGEIYTGVPSELNRKLAAGEIDLSISSSFEYGRNWSDYLLLPGHSISSIGAVGSVLLFCSQPLEGLAGEEIAITGESATSINLLQVLLREFYGCRGLVCRVPGQPVEELLHQGEPALLIGDRAMRVTPPSASRSYDLGELWQRHTGFPFVFALWILRRAAAREQHQAVTRFAQQLSDSRQAAMACLPALARQQPEHSWLGVDGLVNYWQQISYDLTPEHLEGLQLFFRLCCKYELLHQQPELRFFQAG